MSIEEEFEERTLKAKEMLESVCKQKVVYITPELVHGKSFNAFSCFGIAAMALFAFMYLYHWYLS
jgi:hypothetical protein